MAKGCFLYVKSSYKAVRKRNSPMKGMGTDSSKEIKGQIVCKYT